MKIWLHNKRDSLTSKDKITQTSWYAVKLNQLTDLAILLFCFVIVITLF